MPVTKVICHRWGCHRHVASGMQCDLCQSWYHPKCTGLTEAQYESARLPDGVFKCMICLSAPHLPLSTPNTQQANPLLDTLQSPPTPDSPGQLQLPSSSDLANGLKTIQRALSDLADGIASLTSRIENLESSIRKSPLHEAGTTVHRLSQKAIEDVAVAQTDAATRSKRILIRGLKFSNENPVISAKRILEPLSSVHPHLKITSASWFFRRDPTVLRPILVAFSHPGKRSAVLQSRAIISSKFPGVTVHPDLPVAKRKPKTTPLPQAMSVPLSLTPNVTPTCTAPPSPSTLNGNPADVPPSPMSVYASPISRSPTSTPKPTATYPQHSTLSDLPKSTAVQPPQSHSSPQNIAKPSATVISKIHRNHFRLGPHRSKQRRSLPNGTASLKSSLLGPPRLTDLRLVPPPSRMHPLYPNPYSLTPTFQTGAPTHLLHPLTSLLQLLPFLPMYQSMASLTPVSPTNSF